MIARNTVYSAVGAGVPLLVGAALLPTLTRHLGPAQFGLLSIAWAVLEYSAVFDVGLGRATTRFVAAARATGAEDLSDLVATSLGAQLALGALGGLALVAIAPLLAGSFAASSGFAGEARASFYVVAATVPLVLLGNALRSLIEAAHRFDLAAAVRIPSSSATFVVSAAAAVNGVRLPGILLLLLATRALTCLVLVAVARAALPELTWRRPRTRRHLRPLLRFGGWVAVSSVLSPLLLYLDRFMLGAAAGLTEVGYYAAPMELVSRLVILPASFVTVLFPAVSAIAAMGNRPALVGLLGSSECGLALALLPLTCALIAFAPAGLDWWLGPEFARQSATVLRILALGLFVNALAYVPFSFVQALGRPELTARFHLLEFAFHFPLTWVLVTRYGAVGAAAAWTTRVVVDAALVTGAATTLVRLPPGRLVGRRTALVIVAGVGLLAALTAASALRPVLAALGSLAAGGAFAAFAWYGVLEPHERASARALLGTGRLVSAAGGPRC